MKRYDLCINKHGDSLMAEWEDGQYVEYTDAQSAIDTERTRADRAEARVKELEMQKSIVDSELRKAVQEAIGEASMCWIDTPKGVFDSSHALKVADSLLARIADLEKPKTCEGCEFDYGTNECTRCIRNDDAFKDYYTPRREGDK